MDWHDSSCRLDLVSCDGVQSCMRCGSFAPQPPVLPPLTRPTSIRLLRLFCGSYDEGLRGEVFLEDMSNLPVYEAISYTWADEAGDSSLCESIQLFGQEQLKITRNCQNALKRVRRTSESRILWIDAICIDQSNPDERGHQVRLMPQLYSRATTVLVYVGEATSSTDLLLDELTKGVSTPESRPEVYVALQNFFNRDYFSRVWVLQEIVLARKAIVICGNKQAPWTHLSHFNFGEVAVSDRKRLLMVSHQWKGATPGLFPALLDLTRTCKATDLRDKVYSVLGLAIDEFSHGLVADYKITVEQCYIKTALHLASRYGWGQVLQRAGLQRSSLPIPSWAPDWSYSAAVDRSIDRSQQDNTKRDSIRLVVRLAANYIYTPYSRNRPVFFIDRGQTSVEWIEDQTVFLIPPTNKEYPFEQKWNSVLISDDFKVYDLIIDRHIEKEQGEPDVHEVRLLKASMSNSRAASPEALAAILDATTELELKMILEWCTWNMESLLYGLQEFIGEPWYYLKNALSSEVDDAAPAGFIRTTLRSSFELAIQHEPPALQSLAEISGLWRRNLALDPPRQAKFESMGDDGKSWIDMNDAVWRLMTRIFCCKNATVDIS